MLQSILIICGLCICEFVYLLKFICNPQINTWGAFEVIRGHVQRGKEFESLNAHISS